MKSLVRIYFLLMTFLFFTGLYSSVGQKPIVTHNSKVVKRIELKINDKQLNTLQPEKKSIKLDTSWVVDNQKGRLILIINQNEKTVQSLGFLNNKCVLEEIWAFDKFFSGIKFEEITVNKIHFSGYNKNKQHILLKFVAEKIGQASQIYFSMVVDLKRKKTIPLQNSTNQFAWELNNAYQLLNGGVISLKEKKWVHKPDSAIKFQSFLNETTILKIWDSSDVPYNDNAKIISIEGDTLLSFNFSGFNQQNNDGIKELIYNSKLKCFFLVDNLSYEIYGFYKSDAGSPWLFVPEKNKRHAQKKVFSVIQRFDKLGLELYFNKNGNYVGYYQDEALDPYKIQ